MLLVFAVVYRYFSSTPIVPTCADQLVIVLMNTFDAQSFISKRCRAIVLYCTRAWQPLAANKAGRDTRSGPNITAGFYKCIAVLTDARGTEAGLPVVSPA